MLRTLVLVFALLNAGIYFWVHSDPPQLRPEREPDRLERQISPDAVQVLPDLPTASRPAQASTSTTIDFGGPAASAPAAAASSTPAAVKIGDAGPDCAESGPLNDTELATLRKALVRAGVASDALVERKQASTGNWLVYMGRFSDAQTWQAKADELKRLDVHFERVTQPASLSPGLSLGSYASASEASSHLDALSKRGVKTARVVAGPTVDVIHLQVRSAVAGWRQAAGTQHFGACAAQAA